MSADLADATLLVGVADADLAMLLRAHFAQTESFRVEVVTRAADVIPAALKFRPGVIVLESDLPDRRGIEVFRELQVYPRLAHIPIILLIGGTDTLNKNFFLEAGIYDVVEKPVDVAELGLRIRNVLTRTQRDGKLHPITHFLVGQVVETFAMQLLQQADTIGLRLTIQHFDAFRDQYGFVALNEVITYIGNVIADVALELGDPSDFIGQLRDDEYIIVTHSPNQQALQEALLNRLNHQLPQFYNFIDREQGFVSVLEEDGTTIHKPLMQPHIEPYPDA